MIKYKFGTREQDGVVVHINNAKRGEKHNCYICNKPLIAKKGDIRKHHFAHSPNISICAESDLHKRAKFLIAKILNEELLIRKHLRLGFSCSCKKTHYIDILNGVNRVLVEKQVQIQNEKIQPDISLMNSPKIVWGIEIVKTHDVEEKTKAFYENNMIGCIRIKVTTNNFEHIITSLKEEKMLYPGMFEILSMPASLIYHLDYFNPESKMKSIAWSLCKSTEKVNIYKTKRGLQVFPCYKYKTNELDDFTLPCISCKYNIGFNFDNVSCTNPKFIEESFKSKGSVCRLFEVSFYFSSGGRIALTLDSDDVKSKITSHKTLDWFSIRTSDRLFEASFDKRQTRWVEYNGYYEEIIYQLNIPLGFGKYNDRKLKDVLFNDNEYIKWVFSQGPNPNKYYSKWNDFHENWKLIRVSIKQDKNIHSFDEKLIGRIAEVIKVIEISDKVNIEFDSKYVKRIPFEDEENWFVGAYS